MKFLDRLFGNKTTEKRALDGINLEKGAGLLAPKSLTNLHVNEHNALTISTFYRASRTVAETVAGMSFKLFENTNDSREEAKYHNLYYLLHDEPNEEMDSFEFKNLMQFWCVVYGNAYAEIVRNNDNSVNAFYPIHPANVITGLSATGENVIKVTTDHGEVVLLAKDVIHIKGPSLTGCMGERLVFLARESLGLTMALDRAGAAHFGNAMRPGMIFEYPGKLDDTGFAQKNIRQSYKKINAGVDNTGELMILEEGMKATVIPTSPEQSQYNESRQFQINEILRWVGVPGILCYEYGEATWNNATQQIFTYLQFTIDPYLRQWEGQVKRKCLSKQEKNTLYPEFIRETTIRMDPEAQHRVWEIGSRIGIYSPNDIFRMQNRPTVEGGDEYIWQKAVINPNPQQVNNPVDMTGDNKNAK